MQLATNADDVISRRARAVEDGGGVERGRARRGHIIRRRRIGGVRAGRRESEVEECERVHGTRLALWGQSEASRAECVDSWARGIVKWETSERLGEMGTITTRCARSNDQSMMRRIVDGLGGVDGADEVAEAASILALARAAAAAAADVAVTRRAMVGSVKAPIFQ